MRSVSQNAKLPEEPNTLHRIKSIAQTAHFTGFLRVPIKYATLIISSIPEKIRNVTAVPTAGIVTKVGRKVPIMLPTVLNAPKVPTVLPLSSRLSIVYLAREGVTVPRRKQGNTNMTIHARNAAHTSRLLLMVNLMQLEQKSRKVKNLLTVDT